MEALICQAIRELRLIRFYYTGNDTPGERTVEPHLVCINTQRHIALSAWFLRGSSESQEGEGWRSYLLSDMRDVVLLDETFSGARPGYNPTGGRMCRSVRCAL